MASLDTTTSVPTQDLRSEAKDHKRVKTHTVKWSRGGRQAAGGRCLSHESYNANCEACNKRPLRRDLGTNFCHFKQALTRSRIAQSNTMAKKSFRGEVVDAVDELGDNISDSSADFDIDDASAAPELNQVMYSFDAATGPGQGSGILSHAIAQAVERFENNETEKIVKKEYDLVLDGKDEVQSVVTIVDDDFELIDESHLH